MNRPSSNVYDRRPTEAEMRKLEFKLVLELFAELWVQNETGVRRPGLSAADAKLREFYRNRSDSRADDALRWSAPIEYDAIQQLLFKMLDIAALADRGRLIEKVKTRLDEHIGQRESSFRSKLLKSASDYCVKLSALINDRYVPSRSDESPATGSDLGAIPYAEPIWLGDRDVGGRAEFDLENLPYAEVLPNPEHSPTPVSAPPPPAGLTVLDAGDFAPLAFADCLAAAEVYRNVQELGQAAKAGMLFSSRSDGPHAAFPEGNMPPDLWIVGDVHADILSLVNAVAYIRYRSPGACIAFLGDFIDRGPYSHEVLLYLFGEMCGHPGKFCVIAGNHDEALARVGGRYTSAIDPAEYAAELNALLPKAAAGDGDAGRRIALADWAIDFFRRCPRAVFLPDGTLLAHAGFPHNDLVDSIGSREDLQRPECLQDFTWLRCSPNAPRKIPNRSSRGCEFGFKDFALFCERMKAVGPPVGRLIRGHDHMPARFALPPKYAGHPVVTLNSMGRRLDDEFNAEPYPPLCVARWISGKLPEIHRIALPPTEVDLARRPPVSEPDPGLPRS